MSSKILIVEDQFIEANDLRNILEKAGHHICGIAKSVEQALILLTNELPDIVLLDIFLQDELTGIDLAQILSKDNIPFIYLSANSNSSIFEAAKATQPYGFLVKPYREKDILLALDIAGYKHKHITALKGAQAKWFHGLLVSIANDAAGFDQKLLMLVRAFKTIVPADYVVIDPMVSNRSKKNIYNFQRVSFEHYKSISSWEFLENTKLTLSELNNLREWNATFADATYLDSQDFINACNNQKVLAGLQDPDSVKSNLWIPLNTSQEHSMSISFYSLEQDSYTMGHLEILQPLLKPITDVLANIFTGKNAGTIATNEQAISMKMNNAFRDIIGNSSRLLAALDQVNQVAVFDSTVLILGETGVGKEGIAQAIHNLSHRRLKPLVRINCAAIPNNLVESELFGHEKGSFTGAVERRIGKFEQAHGGTIFLDEIGEMPLEIQGKLLRVIQEKELERVGGKETIKTDVRIVAATNRNLYKEVAAGKFRMDLYYRINVFPIMLAPLRERKEDIPLLAAHFLQGQSNVTKTEPKQISAAAMQKLVNYAWPGNVRELQHVIERHVLMNKSPLISFIELPEELPANEAPVSELKKFQSIADIDKAHIIAALEKCNGKVSGRGGAAEMLQLPATTLASKMKKLGIVWKYLIE